MFGDARDDGADEKPPGGCYFFIFFGMVTAPVDGSDQIGQQDLT
jgi:hypothetical protein